MDSLGVHKTLEDVFVAALINKFKQDNVSLVSSPCQGRKIFLFEEKLSQDAYSRNRRNVKARSSNQVNNKETQIIILI